MVPQPCRRILPLGTVQGSLDRRTREAAQPQVTTELCRKAQARRLRQPTAMATTGCNMEAKPRNLRTPSSNQEGQGE